MAQAQRDNNRVPTLLGVSSVDFTTPTTLAVNPATGAVLTEGGGSGGGGMSLTVAASDAPQSIQDRADYVCDGTDDEVQINTALGALLNDKGTVILSVGTFSIGDSINITVSQTLKGQGMDATNIVADATTFHAIHMGNRQSDSIMRNYMGLEDLSVSAAGGANNYDAVWVDGGGNGTHIVNVKASEGKYNFRLTDIDQAYFTNIKAFNARTAAIYCEAGLENTWGNVAFYSPSTAISDNNGVGWLFDASAAQASPNRFDRVSIYGALFYSSQNLTGTVGLKTVVGLSAFTIIGSLFENNRKHVVLQDQTFINLIGCTFLQNEGTTSDIFYLETDNHTVSIYDCRFQQSTNVFDGASGFSHVGLFGKSTNQGNITNIFTGSFGSKYGTDTVFAGDGVLALGLNSQRFGYMFGHIINNGADIDVPNATGTMALTSDIPSITGKASLALDNLASVAINTSLISDTDSTDDLGSSSKYWSNGYVDKIYLNSTATLDGSSAGLITATGDVKIIGTGSTSGTSALKIFKSDGTSYILNIRNNNTVSINAENDPDGWAVFYVNGGFRCDDDFRFKKGSGDQYITRSGGTGYNLNFQCGGDNLVLYGDGGVRICETASDKLGFFGTAPIVEVVDARIDDTVNTVVWDSTTAGVLDAIRDALVSYGLIKAS